MRCSSSSVLSVRSGTLREDQPWCGAGWPSGEVHLGHTKCRLQEASWRIMCGTQRKPGLWGRGARAQDTDGGTSTGGLKGAELERRLRTTTRGVGKL